MSKPIETVADYLRTIEPNRKVKIEGLRKVILENLPTGFQEGIGYGMLAYFVPHTIYPAGYHVRPELPLPFINVANQKNHIALYHMGLYADSDLLDWFTSEYKIRVDKKLDMGKSCIRWSEKADIPYELIGELASKVTPAEWVVQYERSKSSR